MFVKGQVWVGPNTGRRYTVVDTKSFKQEPSKMATLDPDSEELGLQNWSHEMFVKLGYTLEEK